MQISSHLDSSRIAAQRSIEMMTLMAVRLSLVSVRYLSEQLSEKHAVGNTHAAVMSRNAQTFYFATRMLPVYRRRPIIHLYAFFRTIDDLVDEGNPDRSYNVVTDELEMWRTWFRSSFTSVVPRPEIAHDLRRTIDRYAIPHQYFLDFLDGMEQDTRSVRFENFRQLERYCYEVASTVGLAMTYLFDTTSSDAQESAYDLGIAMQLTNILRDVGGDLKRGRIYFPVRELADAELDQNVLRDLYHGDWTNFSRFQDFMKQQIERADRYYVRANPGIDLLPDDSRMPILIASRLYQRILRVIERNNYDSLTQRAWTSHAEKAVEAVSAFTYGVVRQP